MSSNKLPLYLLQEDPSITQEINGPLKSSQRIKYTCFDVSKTLIVFGANSGGIYVFNRKPCEFVQLIPSKDGAITRLAISADERHIGFANGRGVVTVTECEQRDGTTVTSREHAGNEVSAMVWSNMLVCGDDVGRISVVQMPGFITKSIFQTVSQTIMCLDSRICQLDVRDNMLLVSTMTRCYICDTEQEQYRQIGQKLRDGEYGACFVTFDKRIQNGTAEPNKNNTEVKMFNIVDGHDSFILSDRVANTAIFAARPSSRLWEASINGTVKRTHQYKQVLSRQSCKVVTQQSYENDDVRIEPFSGKDEGRSCIFPKIFSINSSVVMSFRKDALYFLDTKDVDNTLWYDEYENIADLKIYSNVLYLWLLSGDVICLTFVKIVKFLIKCYQDEKYELCARLCALYSKFLLSSEELPAQLHILVGLRDVEHIKDVVESIEDVLNKLETLKKSETATQMKSGIYRVHTNQTQADLSGDYVNGDDEVTYTAPTQPETLQSIKDLSLSMTDKLLTTKMIIREKWGDFEEKIKHFSVDKVIETPKISETKLIPSTGERLTTENQRLTSENGIVVNRLSADDDIVYKDKHAPTGEIDPRTIEILKSTTESDKLCKQFFEYFKLSLIADQSNLLSIADSLNCDIKEIYRLMLVFKEHCIKIGAINESEFAPNNIFLNYLTRSEKRSELLDEIINDEELSKYFVESCITVNLKMNKLTRLGCECGFPLPYAHSDQTPEFSALIDEFIEKQWRNNTREQCYNICKQMPHLWRKILCLRRNESLMTVLNLLLQILDEDLLHSFLPQFTLETWDHAVQLYAKLHANKCLNCNKSFDSSVSVKQTLSWDDLGALIIKSVGGQNAMKLMQKHAALINMGELSMKFYHSCFLVTLFNKYDGTSSTQLTDAIYSAYDYEDSVTEICNLLRNTKGQLKNTALPIAVAAKSQHWGLGSIFKQLSQQNIKDDQNLALNVVSLENILANLSVSKGNTDCLLCGLPLVNKVLIKDGGLWVFKCGHIFHGACLDWNKIKFCPSCTT